MTMFPTPIPEPLLIAIAIVGTGVLSLIIGYEMALDAIKEQAEIDFKDLCALRARVAKLERILCSSPSIGSGCPTTCLTASSSGSPESNGDGKSSDAQ
jgi:hypothetical protein